MNINGFSDEICKYLSKNKLSDKLVYEYRLLIEETLVKIFKKADADSILTCEIKKVTNKISIDLVYSGAAICAYQENSSDYGGMILEDYAKSINISQVYGLTKVNLSFNSPSHNTRNNALAVILAIPFACLLTFIFDKNQLYFIEHSVCIPCVTLYFNFIQAISLPLIFLCLLSRAVEFIMSTRRSSSLQKLLVNYMISSIICIFIGYFCCYLVNNLNVLDYSTSFRGEKTKLFGDTIDEIIINIMPNNIINIFLSSNPIPLLIFTGILGFSVNKLRQNDIEMIFNAITPIKNLFSGVMDILMRSLTVVVFFAVIDVFIYYYMIDNIFLLVVVVAGLLLITLMPIVLIYIFYSLILSFSRINPIQFIKDHKENLYSNIQIGSSEDAMYYNVRYYSPVLNNNRKELIERFRLGSNFNMDGTGALTAVTMFALCYMSFIPLSAGKIILIIFTILLLAPQSGGLLISSVVLMNFLGISTDVLSDIVIIEAFMGGLYNTLNTFGDIVAIVASGELKKRKLRKK